MHLPAPVLLAAVIPMGALMASGQSGLFALAVPAFLVLLVLTHLDASGAWHDAMRPLLLRITAQRRHAPSGASSIQEGFAAFIQARPVTADCLMAMLKPFMSAAPAQRLERRMADMARRAIFESGHANDSSTIARHGIMYAMLSVPPSAAAGIALAALLHPGFLGLCSIPAAVLFSGLLQLKAAKSQRKSAIGHELPVFIACASVMERVGVSFYEFIAEISKSRTALFPVLRQDALIFQRNVQYMAMSHTTALRKVAETHPNESFREIVANYNAAYSTSGASTAGTMTAATESAFRAMKNHVRGYTAEANGIAQMVLLVMAVMPMMALATTFVATGKDAVSATVMVILLLPMIITVLLMSVDGKQPRTHNAVPLHRPPLVLACLWAPAALIAGLPPWAVLGTAAALWAGANAFMARAHFGRISGMDAALPAFAQFVTDGRMEGMEIREAVAFRAKSGDPKDALGSVLRDISKQMMFGKSLASAAESARTTSWLSRILFFVLSQVQEGGGGDTHSLQAFANFIKDYVESRREMVSSLKGSVAMGYAIPVLMAVMVVVTAQMTQGMSGDLEALEALPIGFPTADQNVEIQGQSNFLIVECSILIGLLVSKISYFTLKHTAHVCALSATGTALCALLPYADGIAGLISQSFGN